MQITNELHNIGVTEKTDTRFEGICAVPDGVSYNSYVLLDEQIAVFDTVGERFVDTWLQNLCRILQERTPGYLILTHWRPDHKNGVKAFVGRFPNAVILASHKAFQMMRLYGDDVYASPHRVIVDEDNVSLGQHQLRFYSAPMVPWPETTVVYDDTDNTLFSADAFGQFGSADCETAWEDRAARYYFERLVGFGTQVTSLLKKLSALPIKRICPRNGPVLTDTVASLLERYAVWSAYRADKPGVTIAYTSVYGHTADAARELCAMLRTETAVIDLDTCDAGTAISEAFRRRILVLAAPTYHMGLFPAMQNFLMQLQTRHFQHRTVGLIESGSWAPLSSSVLRRRLKSFESLCILDETVSIKGALDPFSREKLRALAAEINERLAPHRHP